MTKSEAEILRAITSGDRSTRLKNGVVSKGMMIIGNTKKAALNLQGENIVVIVHAKDTDNKIEYAIAPRDLATWLEAGYGLGEKGGA